MDGRHSEEDQDQVRNLVQKGIPTCAVIMETSGADYKHESKFQEGDIVSYSEHYKLKRRENDHDTELRTRM
jgi:hypothetical protein